MTIPPEFNEVEHLQSVVRRYVNRQIREDFQDLGGDTWEPETGTTRGAMRHALTHKDNDALPVTLSRLFLYYFTYGKAQALQTPVYGVPTEFYQQEALSYIPVVTLRFQEDVEDIEPGYDQVRGYINFRISGETHKTISTAKLTTLANKVKTNFGANNGFVWRKGKVRCNYADKETPYFFQILSRDIAQGKRVIEQVLDIQTDTPNWKYLNISENSEPSQAFPTIPPTESILGKSKRLPRNRPIADVRFTRAECHIYGVPKAVILFDRTKLYSKALVS